MPTPHLVAVIEDDETLREVYSAVLNSEGFKIITARNGDEGLKLLSTQEPDVILLDMLMPDLNGIEFLKQYEPKKHPTVKIWVFSNLTDHQQEKTALELGAHKYLLKSSYTPSEVANLLKQM